MGLFYGGSSYGPFKYGAGSSITDEAAWNLGKSPVGTFLVGIGTLGHKAMSVADGSAGLTQWTLTSDEDQTAKSLSDSNGTYNNKSDPSDPLNGESIKDYVSGNLDRSFDGTRDGSGNYSLSANFLQAQGTDGYWAFGNSVLSFSGEYSITNGNLGWNATISLSDTFTFSPYKDLSGSWTSATGTSYRLQDSGFINPFSTSATWNELFTTRTE